ncbi:MAG TPA: TIGR03790 family protein [Chthoniobacteraceae bacterium]|jgi:uncharacterized protein (TIGR03790 family)|nr:TIGR03790 family protein [Chthoniobacteraceae bacterium]
MRRVLLLLMVLAATAAHAQESAPPAATREAAATLVVYSNLDPDSAALAAYYAKRRGIPLDHIVGLDCPATEEISRATYDETIAGPLRKIFTDRGWWHAPADPSLVVSDNQIRFIALIRGIPLKIAQDANYAGDSYHGKQQALNTNAAAVDSELATLGVRTRHITGPLKNPYYQSFTQFMDAPLAPLMLVCRLDGPSVDTVKSMIDGAISAERTGLDGFAYIDMRGITAGPMALGDHWLATAADELRRHGMPVICDDSPNLIPTGYPMTHAAVYLGWYSSSVEGPMAQPDFRFVPGAVAVHIHSFSASTLRDFHAGWAGPLVAHGAAVTLGNVYEPYLALTPNLDIFVDRLRNGMTFAESAYASQPVLSWMTTFVGDPLYRPFQNTGASAESGEKPAIEYAAYRKGAHVWFEKGPVQGAAALTASARELHSGIVWEGLGLLQWNKPDYPAAIVSFQEAEKCYGTTEDGLRVVLHQTAVFAAEDRHDLARALAARELTRFSQFPGSALLRAVIGLPATSASPP